MLIAFAIVIIIIGTGILLGVYSIFMPFFNNLSDITEYNVAYYGAISSLERGFLVTKYQEPGFVGSGGRNTNNSFGPNSDAQIDNMGRLSFSGNGTRRNINSRTQIIPNPNQGNIDYLLADTGSVNYNKMDYNKTIKIPLYIDTTTSKNKFYTNDTDIPHIFNGNNIDGILRLPPKIFNSFNSTPNDGLLCDYNDISCDTNQDTLYNEKIVNRTIKGIFVSGAIQMPYTILPTTSIHYYENPVLVNLLRDNNIREDAINTTMGNNYQPNIQFSSSLSNLFNPNTNNTLSTLAQHNILAENPDMIKNLDFITIIQKSINPELQLLLTTPLISSNQNIYPFLEYQLQFDGDVASRFYNIKGVGKAKDYQVTISAQKPTTQTTVVGDFTIIF